MRPRNLMLMTAALAALAAPAAAQQNETTQPGGGAVSSAKPAGADSTAKSDSTSLAAQLARLQKHVVIQHIRPNDQRGINMFEPPKQDATPFTGFRLDFGAAFDQQFQDLSHRNAAAPKPAKDATGKDYDANQLLNIGWGVNLPEANLVLDAQLAPGIRVQLESYLASHHHNEAWVKGGYLLMDASPIDNQALNALFRVLTIKAGMFPLDYGDAIYRRSDNGQAIFNPFVGNLLLDAWTFEPGIEVYARKNGLIGMVGVTTGSNKGDVRNPTSRSPSFLAKAGFDKQLTELARVRLTGSYYRNNGSASTLFWGDRSGSRYVDVLENTQASLTSNAFSGQVNPGFSSKVEGIQINPFVKLGGLELFGVVERGEGRAVSETASRVFHQYAGEAVYRFLPGERMYVGGRYDWVDGTLPIAGANYDVTVHRGQLAAGWFVTPSVLLKGEYVDQRYHDFPAADIRSGGKFNGFMMEGVVAF